MGERVPYSLTRGAIHPFAQASLKKTVTSLAFINFGREDSLIKFAAAFNGHVFVSERGTPYKISIEYAPFQKACRAVWSSRPPFCTAVFTGGCPWRLLRTPAVVSPLCPPGAGRREAQR